VNDKRKAKSKRFLQARMALRKLPYHCSRCGAEIEAEGGKCQPCRDYCAQYRAQKRQHVQTAQIATLAKEVRALTAIDPRAVYRMQQELAELREQVRYMRRYGQAMYAKGIGVGILKERQSYQEARAEWAAFNDQQAHLIGCQPGFEEKLQMFHQLAEYGK
jgi:hypothetical protein